MLLLFNVLLLEKSFPLDRTNLQDILPGGSTTWTGLLERGPMLRVAAPQRATGVMLVGGRATVN